MTTIETLKAEYAPYHTMPEFELGLADYAAGKLRNLDGVAGQAYDRGAECAMRLARLAHANKPKPHKPTLLLEAQQINREWQWRAEQNPENSYYRQQAEKAKQKLQEIEEMGA